MNSTYMLFFQLVKSLMVWFMFKKKKKTQQFQKKPNLCYIRYFDSTYISGQLRPGRVNDGLRLTFRRPPLEKSHLIDGAYAGTVSDQTTNKQRMCEGWNNRFHEDSISPYGKWYKPYERSVPVSLGCSLIQDERGIRPKEETREMYTELHTHTKKKKVFCNLCGDIGLDFQEENPALNYFLVGVLSHNRWAGQPNI